MFNTNTSNLLPLPQISSTDAGSVRLRNAIFSLKAALSDILDSTNYTNADINDQYVSYALSLYSKYNNDLDFHNIMQFPIQIQPNDYNNIHKQTIPSSESYIYSTTTPYLFSMFPSFPQLPTSVLKPSLLEDPFQFEKLCVIGSSLLKYLFETTLYKKNPADTISNSQNTVKAIINRSSLSILCGAYNIDFNYKFIGMNLPPHKLFLAYFGCYYNHYLKNIIDDEQPWKVLYTWSEQLVGFGNDEDVIKSPKSPKQNITTLNKSEAVSIASPIVTPSLKAKSINTTIAANDGGFELQDFLQSIQQDINQSKIATCELLYKVDDYPKLKSGFFTCRLIINDTEVSSCNAMNKKLARSGCALLAGIDTSFLKFIRRSQQDYWFKKFLDKSVLIKKKMSNDPRFDYSYEENSENVNDNYNETNTNTNSDDSTTPRYASPISATMGNSEKPLLETDHDDIHKKIPLSTSKEKVYAFYNSRYGIVPKYTFQQLGNSKFEAKLYLNEKLASVAIGMSKKDASAKAAMQVIEQSNEEF